MKRYALLPVLAMFLLPLTGAEPPQQAAPQAPLGPSWAFPAPDKDQPVDEDSGPKRMPESSKTYTSAQIDDLFNPPDWFPEEHGPVPEIVQHGVAGKAQACGSCHLMSGLGHPESANLAGLSAPYIEREMADFKSGARKDAARMNAIAANVSDEDARQAAEWFAALKPKPWVKVIEADTVPKTYVIKTRMRVPSAGGATEPIGSRIIEVPEDPLRGLSRDPHSGFVAYVPVGSIAKGKAIVEGGAAGKTIQCAICHGPSLTGMGEVPRIIGLSPLYIARQLYGFQSGTRAGLMDAQMKDVAAHMTDDDILAISAYLASRQP